MIMKETCETEVSEMDLIRELRRELHACPRLSGEERDPVEVLTGFLRAHTSLELHPEGNRLWCAHREPGAGETVAFRADVDAIPGACGPYHGCGHDGHSAVLAGLALALEGRTLGKNVLFLFQNSEETGEGAKPFRDHLLEREQIDRVYGFHNLPGFEAGTIYTTPGTFACASRGFVAEVTGSQAHAAYPEQGRNPARLISGVVLALPELAEAAKPKGFDGLLMATVVEVQVGAENFGVSAGSGRLCLTLRSTDLDLLEDFQRRIRGLLEESCAREGMALRCTVRDSFPDTTCDPRLVAEAREKWAAKSLPQRELAEAMRWSEDFGWYLKEIPGVFFGLGAGEDWPGLHTPEYEFNDEVIDRAVAAFSALL